MKEVSEELKPYDFHGLDIQPKKLSKEAITDCPFCGRENKFSLRVDKGTWRCLVCDQKGNQYIFLESLWNNLDEKGIEELAKDRGVEVDTLRSWGIGRSPLTGDWLVPGYNMRGELRQLYRYVNMKGGKKRLLATPTMTHCLHGVNLYNPGKPVVYLCEGPWDAMRLWEVLTTTKEKNGKFIRTKSTKGTLIEGANVLAVPGCSTFHESWKSLFIGKQVYIVYDNDHPRKNNGKEIPSAAYEGIKRVTRVLGDSTKSTSYLRWGPNGYDKKLPSGTDVRDLLNGSATYSKIHTKLKKVPEAWKLQEDKKKKEVYPTACNRWLTLSNQWRKALKWGEGLEVSLSVMLASIVSTDISGDQLWIKVIGPASCGKSTLCEAVSVARNFVLAKSTIRGFHSGFKSDSDGSEDNSLIVQVAGKTLVTKDGDTLLQSPNLGQILSEARDIYDKTSRTHYRNKTSKEYTGINMTWILCGTSSLRSIDSSELGERFLDCVIMEKIDDEFEEEVLLKVAEREDRNMSSGKSKSNTGHEPELLKAMQLTGGYIEYLRKNDEGLLAQVVTPKENLHLIAKIGKFVSCMRARPSTRQTESVEREFGARLVSQHLRLAKCLAVVLNRKSVDNVVMKRVVKVALDTSRGITFEICRVLKEEGGAESKLIALETNQNTQDVNKLLRFLARIDVVEPYSDEVTGYRPKKKWRLTPKIEKLWNEVTRQSVRG